MNAQEALRALRDLTLDGSIRLMHTLSTDQTLEQLLEQAKGGKKSPADPNVPAPAGGIQHHMTKANKRKTLVLLYELLMHPDGDVRRIAGRIMGKILANAGPRYRKERPLFCEGRPDAARRDGALSESAELWTHYIGLCLHPDYRISSKHALRISNSLKTICQSLFASCEERRPGAGQAASERADRGAGRRPVRAGRRAVPCAVPLSAKKGCRSCPPALPPCSARETRSWILSRCICSCA